MIRDEQARQRLVEIALTVAHDLHPLLSSATAVRAAAGFKNPRKGHSCAAGLTAAMDKAGLLVPAPGTSARRGAIALLDFVSRGGQCVYDRSEDDGFVNIDAQPGDIIAWLQHPPPDPAGWRRGHVALIVKVDEESLTTVGWNEGPSPGRVMLRRLWRSDTKQCDECGGSGSIMRRMEQGTGIYECEVCRGRKALVRPRFSTVLLRRPGGLYGIARPVAA